MMKNRDWHKDFYKIPGLRKAGTGTATAALPVPVFCASTLRKICARTCFSFLTRYVRVKKILKTVIFDINLSLFII